MNHESNAKQSEDMSEGAEDSRDAGIEQGNVGLTWNGAVAAGPDVAALAASRGVVAEEEVRHIANQRRFERRPAGKKAEKARKRDEKA
jgi:homogentisate 1,2-dioxygenase